MVADFSQDIQEILRDFSVGSLAYVYKDSDTDLAIEVEKKPAKKCKTNRLWCVKHPLNAAAQVVGWLGERGAVRAYVAKAERAHYLRLLGGDTQLFEQANKFSNKKDENGDAEALKD